jgi:hypothetical protein
MIAETILAIVAAIGIGFAVAGGIDRSRWFQRFLARRRLRRALAQATIAIDNLAAAFVELGTAYVEAAIPALNRFTDAMNELKEKQK